MGKKERRGRGHDLLPPTEHFTPRPNMLLSNYVQPEQFVEISDALAAV